VHRTKLKSVLALAVVIGCLPAPAVAQELRKDSVWNGVVTGAAIGAGVGAVMAKTTDDLCSVPACAFAFAFAGGWLGHHVDRVTGTPAPVTPGQWVDDSKWNGALIGAGIYSAAMLVDRGKRCGTGPGRVQCTAGGAVNDLVNAVLFGAAVGALIDAAIPSRAPGRTGSTPAKSRRLLLTYSMRF
jgi:hypothetical protein